MWYKAESNTRPDDVSNIDGKHWVRRNIKEVEKQDEISKTTYKMFEYEEAQMNESEYSQYQDILKNAGDVAYLSMMTGIDLPDEEE